ncbi:DcrB-related protein [Erwinia pyrifoliae]|uniref:DcrB-related protein n=1 Tax=Erwinia pyrifoliae TaxID=79967 RepID=UPI0034D963F6
MPDFSRCTFTEGSVTLPEGYSDRTVNVLLAGDDASPPSISHADALQPTVKPGGLITSQLATLSARQKGWVLKGREPATLGGEQLPGESVSASYLRDGQRIWQRQAVFALAEGRVLVFTLAQPRKPSPQDEALLQQVLASYRQPVDIRQE